MNRNKNIFRIEPGAQKRSAKPHNTVYNAFSRPSSLQISATRGRGGDGVTLMLTRAVGSAKKDRKLMAALAAMSGSGDMLSALLSDAFGHAAVKHAQENFRGGWTVNDSRVGLSRGMDGSTIYSATVRLRRFIG